ncbi:MAG: hypothetical protein Kow00121_66470 [Elainellaceae cyanobacterium]
MTEASPQSIANITSLPANETERLAALRRYNILDTPSEQAFDRITSLAARLFNVPTALVSLVDESRAWFKSCYGFNQQEVARDATICSFALLYNSVLIVPDARQDERFACNPFVQSEPGLRFYAGAPLLTKDGLNLGTLCLLDTTPRDTFTDEQKATLADLAAIVMDELDLRLALAMQTAVEQERQQAEEMRQQAAQRLQLYADVVHNAQVGIVVWQLEELLNPGSFRLIIANPAASKVTGFDFKTAIGKTMAESFPRLLKTPLAQQYLEVVQTGEAIDLGEVTYGEDGISAGIYSLKAFPLPDQCLGLAFENITTRKQIEIQLKESQRYNQQIAEAVPGVLFVHDIIQQQNVYTNRQITDLLGYTSEQVQAMGINAIATLVHPDDVERIFAYFETFHTATDDAVLGIEYRARHVNGEWRWIYTQSVVFNRTADDSPYQILGVSIDITDRKQSEVALIEQEQRYRYIFEAVSVAIWEENFSQAKTAIDQLKAAGIQDFRQYFTDHPEFVQQMISLIQVQNVNQAALHMFGAQAKAELLASLDQIFVPETKAAFIEELLAIAQGETSFAAETVLQTLQGDRLNVWFSITFPPASESYDHVLVSLLDITQRKQAEAALQASEERYRHLAEATPQIVWTTDANGMATYFNPYWYDYTGMDEAESMGLGSPNALHPDDRDRVLQQWLIAVEIGESYDIEIRLRRWDGTYRWFLCRGLPMRDANGQIVGWVGTNTDIDDQKRIQDELRQSEERLALALRSAQAGMWQWFKADNRTIWSDENYQLLGYSPGQVSSSYETWIQAVHPDDRQMAQQAVQQTLDENASLYFEYRVCLPDGSVRWLADIGQITYDEQGNQEGMIGIQIDISKRKQSELERERSEAILNAFLTASPIALTLLDPDFRFIYANEALAQIDGLPLSEHLGRTLYEVVPDMAHQFAPMLRQIIETQEPVLNLEYNGEVRPGIYRHTIANHFPVCLPDGEVLGVGVTVTDVSELKRVEAKLRQHSARLNLLYETTSELLSSRQPLKLMNQLFSRLSSQLDLHYYYHFQLCRQEEQPRLQLQNYAGISEEQGEAFESIELGQAICGLVAQECRQIVLSQAEIAIHPNAQAICSMGISAYAGQPLMVHGRLIGTLSFASRTRTHFTAEEADLLQAISEQVAIALDRAELVASLQRQTEDLAQANRVKDEFLAVLSHELRSPLNPILGWTKLLQTGKFDPQKTKQALEVIERNAKQQTQLIDDLLDISKILRGKLALNEAPVDLAWTIAAALETMRLAAEAKGIQIKTDFDSSLPPVLGDSGRLQQVVLNLLSNAIKFTPPGGQVKVRLQQVEPVEGLHGNQSPNSYAQITVSDTGKGIAPEFLPYVFESFRQEDGKTTRKFGGLGLGLAIVRQLTELHGGTVRAESMGEGSGSTFTICLPLMQASGSSSSHSPSAASFNEATALAGLRILIVDDEADMRDLAVIILEQVGAIVQTAASATEALAQFRQWQPALLISDIGMPDVDGYGLMRQVRALPPEQGGQIPAIALTAYASEFDRQQALQAGFQKHICKPVEPEVLVKAILDLVGSVTYG